MTIQTDRVQEIFQDACALQHGELIVSHAIQAA